MDFRKLLCIPLFALLVVRGGGEEERTQPNIVFILADDAGYADFGFQGSKVMKTPRLDAFRREGMKFKQAYVTAAVCGPSRAGLYTGKYQQRFGFEENNVPGYMSPSGLTGDEMGLPVEEKTIGDYMKSLGYHTGIIGKWHQGNADRFHPLKRGFDEFYGFRGGARSFYPYASSDDVPRKEDRMERGFGKFQEPEKYLTEALADEAEDFLERNRERPFFLVLAFNAVHTPMQAEKRDLAEFPELTGKRKTLAAMNLALDRACGRVFDQLEKLGLDKDTLVIFTNDNGGPSDSNSSDNRPLSGTKANHLEGGIRVPFLMRWPGVIPENSEYDYPVSFLDVLPTCFAAGGGDAGELSDVDGVNLRPFLTGKDSGRPHTLLFWKKENRAAVRDGDWKLLRFPDRPAELYDLSADPSELTDLAGQNRDKVREMFAKLFQWELTLERPAWQLRREFEGKAMKRMDDYWPKAGAAAGETATPHG